MKASAYRALVLGAGAALWAGDAAAEGRHFLNPGIHGGAWFGGATAGAVGVHASWFRQGPDGVGDWGWGPFGYAQLLVGEDVPVGGHFAGGVEVGWALFGVELGVAARTAFAGAPASVGAHVAPYVSIGLAHVALAVYLPVAGQGPEDTQVGVVGGFSLPIVTNRERWDDWFTFRMPHGRPLRVGGDERVASEVEGDAWCAGGDGAGGDEANAEAWRREGAEEHASVATFARLSLQLMALGAPPSLVEAAHRAALDEVNHALRCYALARRADGRARSPGPLPEALAEFGACDVVTLAVEALREGCVGEGVAARELARRSGEARDAAERDALAAMAADEARHAELAWDVVAWALATGGAAVAGALVAEAAREGLPEDVGARLWGTLGVSAVHRGAARRRRLAGSIVGG